MRLSPIISDTSNRFSLNSNPTFKFLRSEVESLPNEASLSETLKKSTIQTLTLLLNEVALTPSKDQQTELLTKVSNWYCSHSPKMARELKILTPKFQPSRLFPSTPSSRGLTPNIASSALHSTPEPVRSKYNQFTNSHYLRTYKQLDSKYSIRDSSRSRFGQNLNITRNTKRFLIRNRKKTATSEKPKNQSPLFDLRTEEKTESRNLNSSQRLNAEHVVIEDIKRRLANRHLFVSSKCLENGISLYVDKDPVYTNQPLPTGGEMLMKSPPKPIAKTAKSGRRFRND